MGVQARRALQSRSRLPALPTLPPPSTEPCLPTSPSQALRTLPVQLHRAVCVLISSRPAQPIEPSTAHTAVTISYFIMSFLFSTTEVIAPCVLCAHVIPSHLQPARVIEPGTACTPDPISLGIISPLLSTGTTSLCIPCAHLISSHLMSGLRISSSQARRIRLVHFHLAFCLLSSPLLSAPLHSSVTPQTPSALQIHMCFAPLLSSPLLSSPLLSTPLSHLKRPLHCRSTCALLKLSAWSLRCSNEGCDDTEICLQRLLHAHPSRMVDDAFVNPPT